jgi:Gpi18-like mannosyltransferase
MFSDMGAPILSLRSLVRHPVFLIAVAGIAVRFLIFPLLEVGYDTDFWATIMRNLRSGEGLYGLEGYYYTPVWGYILSFLSVLQGVFLNIDVIGLRVAEVFQIESYSIDWFLFPVTATVTSVAFNFFMKIPFLISDLIIGYLIYWLIKDKTGDMRKATIGFGLWFLCPLVICVTSVSGMFDTFSVLFSLLCIIMVKKDKLFLAGVLFSFAVLMKFFPLYLGFILLAYIMARHRDDGLALRSVAKAVAGTLTGALVLLAPLIAEGSLTDSILFITVRASGGGEATLLNSVIADGAILVYLLSLIAAAALAFKLAKKKEDLDDAFHRYALLLVALLFIYPPAPQYLVLLIPFLAMQIAMTDKRFKISWVLVSVGGMMYILSNNFMLFFSLGAFTDLISLEYIMSMMGWFQTPLLSGLSPTYILYCVSGAIYYLGVVSVVLLFLRDRSAGRRGQEEKFSLSRVFSYRRQKAQN